jgi:hypothetical protein
MNMITNTETSMYRSSILDSTNRADISQIIKYETRKESSNLSAARADFVTDVDVDVDAAEAVLTLTTVKLVRRRRRCRYCRRRLPAAGA